MMLDRWLNGMKLSWRDWADAYETVTAEQSQEKAKGPKLLKARVWSAKDGERQYTSTKTGKLKETKVVQVTKPASKDASQALIQRTNQPATSKAKSKKSAQR